MSARTGTAFKESKSPPKSLPYDLEEPEDDAEITRALMRLSERSLSKYADEEPDIY
ncbi:MAG TPA: hypothetical protein PLQ49_09500 [Methanothrix sp.]|nr:hypothetical protein [Methanothrix sp.]HRW82485.1 hypothetical protein [Methanothrix sp.]